MAFFRLPNLHALRRVTLKACVLIQVRSARIDNLLAVSHFLVGHRAGISLTQKANALGLDVGNDQILFRVHAPASAKEAVPIRLVFRALARALGAINDQVERFTLLHFVPSESARIAFGSYAEFFQCLLQHG